MRYHLPVGTFIERCNGTRGGWEPMIVFRAVTYDEIDRIANSGASMGDPYLYFRLPPIPGWAMIRVLNHLDNAYFLLPDK